jgi:hypothetical protein
VAVDFRLGSESADGLLYSGIRASRALERVPAEGRDKPAQFIPIRFVFTNKLDEDDKLVLAFDAFALSRSLGFEIGLGKIIHGDDYVALKVETSALTNEVQKCLGSITILLSNPAPPDFVLNRHCAECDFLKLPFLSD